MKRKQRNSGDGQEWLNTYADMITLVLTFFVLLYSISNINMVKLEKVAEAMQKKLGIESKLELKDLPQNLKYPQVGDTKEELTASEAALNEAKEKIESYMQANHAAAEVTQEDDVLYIRFKNEMLFAPDSPDIRQENISYLDYVGDVLKAKEPEILAIYINGHTADAPDSAWNDRILSSQRADNVAIYLEEQKGIEPKKLISRGYGKNYPIADNSTKEGRDQNRRVDIIILGKDFEWAQLEGDGSGSAQKFDPLTPIDVPGAQTQ